MSGSMSRNKGARWERACRKFLSRWLTDYTHLGTSEPDLMLGSFTHRVAVECKDQASMRLPEWHRQLQAEVEGSEADVGVLFVKRHGSTDPRDAWVIMSAHDFVWWLEQVR